MSDALQSKTHLKQFFDICINFFTDDIKINGLIILYMIVQEQYLNGDISNFGFQDLLINNIHSTNDQIIILTLKILSYLLYQEQFISSIKNI